MKEISCIKFNNENQQINFTLVDFTSYLDSVFDAEFEQNIFKRWK
jgi:hypothetical protein